MLIHWKPSERATILIGYIPVSKLECFSKPKCQYPGYQVFHDCMKSLLEPLIKAGQDRVEMVCADGFIHIIYPILCTYVADYPEQCLVACNNENWYPWCEASAKELGSPLDSVLWSSKMILKAMCSTKDGDDAEFVHLGLQPNKLFWKDLPDCNISSSCFMPDLLHQLHKGVFKDHIVSWASKCVEGGKVKIDHQFRAMPQGTNLQHFKKGITMISQWNGMEYNNMEKVFLGVLAGQAEPGLICVMQVTLDFIYYTHFESHTIDSLHQLEQAWISFHDNLHYFSDKGIWKSWNNFNILKLHSMWHYISSIISQGSADGYSTESPERLHIDFAKSTYWASNKKGRWWNGLPDKRPVIGLLCICTGQSLATQLSSLLCQRQSTMTTS